MSHRLLGWERLKDFVDITLLILSLVNTLHTNVPSAVLTGGWCLGHQYLRPQQFSEDIIQKQRAIIQKQSSGMKIPLTGPANTHVSGKG